MFDTCTDVMKYLAYHRVLRRKSEFLYERHKCIWYLHIINNSILFIAQYSILFHRLVVSVLLKTEMSIVHIKVTLNKRLCGKLRDSCSEPANSQKLDF